MLPVIAGWRMPMKQTGRKGKVERVRHLRIDSSPRVKQSVY